MRYYSQHGEDFLISLMFSDVPVGTFVEIGCIDGRRFSNTLALEEQGWSGLCVEAHPDYIEALRTNRPASAVVHCAVGSENAESVTFYANARGSFSTLDGSQEAAFKSRFGEWFTGFVEVPVAQRTMSRLLDERNLSSIDVLSLDVEGFEVECLKGLDLERHRPRLIVVESEGGGHESAIDGILGPSGYAKVCRIGPNLFYTLEPARYRWLAGRRYQFALTHTQHPLDNGGDSVTTASLDLRLRDSSPVEPEEARLLDYLGFSASDRGNLLVYAGANRGRTLNMLRPFFDKVIAFEPDPELFAGLSRLFSADEAVELINAALSVEDGTTDYYIHSSRDSSSLAPMNEGIHPITVERVTEVRSINLSRLLRSRQQETIDLYYSDIQGMDLDVLTTLRHLVEAKAIRAIVCEVEKDEKPRLYRGMNNKYAGFLELLGDNYRVFAERTHPDWITSDVMWVPKD